MSIAKEMTNEELITIAKNGDENAKNLFFSKNDKFCYFIAEKFNNSGISKEELAQIARFGMLKAYNSFDVSKNIKFATYSSRCMMNEILMVIRRNKKHKGIGSLDDAFTVDEHGNELTLMDVLGNEDNDLSSFENSQFTKQIVDKFMETSDTKMRGLLQYRILSDDELTQKQLSDKLGLSQSYISRLEKKMINNLKKIANGIINNKPTIKGSMNNMSKYASKIVAIMEKAPETKQVDILKAVGLKAHSQVSTLLKQYREGKFDGYVPDYSVLALLPKSQNKQNVDKPHVQKISEVRIENDKEVVLMIPEYTPKAVTGHSTQSDNMSDDFAPAYYLRKILNGEDVIITNENTLNILSKVMELVELKTDTKVKQEWTISLK